MDLMDFEMDLDEDLLESDEEDSSSEDERGGNQSLKRIGHVAVKYKNDMIAWGGYKQTPSLNTESQDFCPNELLIYNPVLQKWSQLRTQEENSPHGSSGACGLVHDGNLYIYGGYCHTLLERQDHGYNNEIYRLDLSSLQWERCATEGTRPLACDKLTGWVHGNRLYFFGGYGFGNHRSSYALIGCDFCIDIDGQQHQGWNNQLVSFDVNTRKWSWPATEGPPPKPRAAHAAAKVGSRVYVFGGRNLNVRMNDLHMLNMETRTWSGSLETKGNLPQGRSWHSLTTISDDHLILYGGFSQQQEALNECWMLTLSTLTWCSITLPVMRPRLWHTACPGEPGEIIIFGGSVGNILSPRVPGNAEDVIILWFSPKSLLRICLDAVLGHADLLKGVWPLLPVPLQELLLIKHVNADNVKRNIIQ